MNDATRVRHRVTYADDKQSKNGNRWPCWCKTGIDHDDQDLQFQVVVREEMKSRAVKTFEQRMGFAYTADYEGSREWSDAVSEAQEVKS